MNNMMQRFSRRSWRVNLNLRSALAAVLLCSGTAIGVVALSGQGVGSALTTSWHRVPELDPGPGRRRGGAGAYDEARHEVVMFGGFTQDQGLINETWTWDGSTWTQQHPSTAPPPRRFAAMAYDAAIGKVILFGGQVSVEGSNSNDTWAWDGSNWTQLSPANSPPPRENHSLAYDKEHQQLVLFGGNLYRDDTGTYPYTRAFADTWVFDGTTWTRLEPPSSPTGRSYAKMVYDPINRGLILYGGFLTSESDAYAIDKNLEHLNAVNETWLWDGSTWTRLSPLTSPPRTRLNSLVYDNARSKAVLHASGNYDPSSELYSTGQTWEWDGQDWTKRAVSSPTPRQNSVLVYAPNVNRVLMYGGNSCGGDLNEQWQWDGSSWTWDNPFPEGAGYRAMAFDTDRNNSVLFGGICSGLIDLTDTWTWNGSLWTRLETNSPPPRVWATMAYDPERKVTVLFGGRIRDPASGRSLVANDTWTFDGTR